MEKFTKTIETTRENAEAAEKKAKEWGADYSRLHARIDEFLASADDELAQKLFMLIKKSKGEVITVPEMTEEELISAVQSLHRRRIRRVEYIDLEETEIDTVSESTKN